MQLDLWQVDAFAAKPLEGNPAAIVPLAAWLDDGLMQRIAGENNLAETAFFVRRAEGRYALRWFTPEAEVDLCGHATLASAWVVFEELEIGLPRVEFETRSGTLVVERRTDGRNAMSLPSDSVAPFDGANGFAAALGDALGVAPPKEIFRSRYMLAVWDDAAASRACCAPSMPGD